MVYPGSTTLDKDRRPGLRSWVPYWAFRVLDFFLPCWRIKLGRLRPGSAFIAVYPQEGYRGTFSGRVIRRSGDGRQVLVAYFAWVGGEPDVYQIWRDADTPVAWRLTCPSLDRADV